VALEPGTRGELVAEHQVLFCVLRRTDFEQSS
jgi:hypothetical protein